MNEDESVVADEEKGSTFWRVLRLVICFAAAVALIWRGSGMPDPTSIVPTLMCGITALVLFFTGIGMMGDSGLF